MSRDPLKELRRYVRADNKAKTASVLRTLSEQYPDDCFVRAECQRLHSGKSLYSSLDYQSYRRILHKAAEETLRILMQRHPISGIERMVKGKIRRLLATFTQMESRMQGSQEIAAEILEYKKALRHELRKRNLLVGGRCAIALVVALAVLLIAGATAWQMRHRAGISAQALDKAVETEDWQRVLALKDAAKSGINKLLYPPLEASLNKAEAWIAHKKAIHREAHRIILSLQTGQCDITTMPLSRRALMERYLRALPRELDDLSPAWNNYCDQAKQQWLQQLPDIQAKLCKPLPAMPTWSGQKQDYLLAQHYGDTLSTLLKEYEDAVDAYRLDTSLLTPLKERLATLNKLRKELMTWQRMLKSLTTTTNYADYLAVLKNIGSPECYPPALELALTLQHLPSEKDIGNHMRDPEGKISPAQMAAMPDILLKQGATFCKEGAASAQQIELLDDLFTTRTLRTKLYRIRSAQGMEAYSASAFCRESDGTISFRRSELDPAFRMGASNKERWPATGVKQQVIDPTGLVSAIGLERHTFFIRNNLPASMSAVLNYTHKGCPALAKAYVYDILLRVLQRHEHPALIGAQYSPSLQQDISSFTRMKQTLGLALKAGCWLQATKDSAAAETVAAAWFAKRKGRNYAAEIKKNYSPIAALHPVFIGYVGRDGKAILCHKPQQGDELWYQGKDGLCHDEQHDVAYAQALPFSPLFIKAKDKKKKP